MADYPRLDPNGLLYYTEQMKNKINDALPVDMVGATSQTNGVHGLVPQPNAGQQKKFLRGDGTWAEAENTIDSISVNGTSVSPDANKNVNIIVPTKVSDITNDLNYQTGTEVETAINTAIGRTYKPGGSKTFATLPALIAANLGYVYNVTDAFTTTADFVEGAGKTFPANTDVGIVDVGTAGSPVYKYNIFSGFVDLSEYVQRTEMTTIPNSQIDDIIDTAFA